MVPSSGRGPLHPLNQKFPKLWIRSSKKSAPRPIPRSSAHLHQHSDLLRELLTISAHSSSLSAPSNPALCAGRNDYHFLSKCTYLPADDREFLTKARLTSSLYEDVETEDSDSFHPPQAEDTMTRPCPSARIVSRRVSTKQSPHFNAFYCQH